MKVRHILVPKQSAFQNIIIELPNYCFIKINQRTKIDKSKGQNMIKLADLSLVIQKEKKKKKKSSQLGDDQR